MFGGALFWFLMGMVFVLVVAGARQWTTDLGIGMSWWKWLLAALWYGLLNLTVAAPLTLVGEFEAHAGGRLFAAMAVITFILGVGLWRLLRAGQEAPSGEDAPKK
jgi:hypothetical protein